MLGHPPLPTLYAWAHAIEYHVHVVHNMDFQYIPLHGSMQEHSFPIGGHNIWVHCILCGVCVCVCVCVGGWGRGQVETKQSKCESENLCTAHTIHVQT